MHVALGRPWCGREVAQGAAVYLAPEGAHSVSLRHHAWCRHHGIDSFEEAKQLWIKGGAIDGAAADNSRRRIASDLRTQLANRGLIKVDGDRIRLVIGS
jgi:AAA domain